jgi:hypothetical protein
VLAQLERRSDVETAEVDRRGELVRIRTLGDGDRTAIRNELERMGFAAEETGNAVDVVRWYGPSAVGELSREEGTVIAARVVPLFGAENGLRWEQIDVLTTRVAAALYECFIGHQDAALGPGGLASPCGGAVTEATSALLGPDRAAALARAVEADLTGTSGA